MLLPNMYFSCVLSFRAMVSSDGNDKRLLIMSKAVTVIFCSYYFLYKLNQQNIFIHILKSKDDIASTEVFPRLLALTINLFNTAILEVHFQTRTIKKIVLSVYTSILTILLYIFRDIGICEITLFILNLTICEAILYNEFLTLWQIQLCVEISIFTNYMSKYILLSIKGIFIPFYMLWIYSVLLPSVRIKYHNNTNAAAKNKSQITGNQQQQQSSPQTTKQVACFLYWLMQAFMLISNILVGCSTIRNNIFIIFTNDMFTTSQIVITMSIMYLVTLCLAIVPKIGKNFRILIILTLILGNYIGHFFIERV